MQENELAVRTTATIAAPAEQVWQVLADLHSYHQWHPSLELLDGPAAEHLTAGTVLRLRADRGTPAEREFSVTVTEVAKPTVLAWEGGDPHVFVGRHRFTLTPQAGGTRLLDEELFSGPLAQAVLAEHRAALEARYQASATALKETAEGRPELSRFTRVDAGTDPGPLIAFLEAHKTLPGLMSAKTALLDELRLERARSALDVGCGLGDDVIALARRLPPGGKAVGVDASEAMIRRARDRATGLGLNVRLHTGDAACLPFDDGSFDACRTERLLVHVPEPQQVIAEMTRATRPGGRVAALEPDPGTIMVDHTDRDTTEIITRSFAGAVAQGWIGRQLPRLFRQAGLTEVSVAPTLVILHRDFFRMTVANHVSRLVEDGVLTSQQVGRWWSELDRLADSGDFLAGMVFFLTVGTRP